MTVSVGRVDGSECSISSSFFKYSLATEASVGADLSADLTGLFPLVVFGDLRLFALLFREIGRAERREVVELFRTKVGVPDREPTGLAMPLGLRVVIEVLLPEEFDGK